jgi:environmental stress-induced protein Ves
MARVASDGPFSSFVGIDRTLAVIAGSGLVLTIGDRAPITLAAGSAPVSFGGETPTSAQLLAGEITDLNVMTRRGRFIHRLTRIEQPIRCDFSEGYAIAIVIAINADATIASDAATGELHHNDTAILTRAVDSSLKIVPDAGCDCYLILLAEQPPA